THAPARGLGDIDDVCHRGFECFRELLDRYHPLYHCYGHVHLQYVPTQPRLRQYGETTMVNASGKYLIELPDRPEKPKKWWQRKK
ncbi:MAG: metallophosphoesterase, partial [Oscillospiraceae bacterium]|nr:metallophosphoesterase [Oscillospiraceae bacterium]